ncbi:DUF6801 domain-containing protein, partial [Amycolatopsis sp. H20-H5]|uniref:DUF6801 domain-containing protein n=1 Tax=Amycolatopsis sp. H20-H5 TaxID=3046309 RepID=UPI002DB74ED1
MKLHWKSRKLAHGLAAGTAAVAVAGALVLVSGGASQAAPVTLTLDYSCPFPILADPLILTVKIDSTLPDNAIAGQKTPAITFAVDVTVPADGTDGLALVGAATVEGSAKAAAVLKYPVDKTLNLQLPLTIAQVPVPASGPFHVKSSGAAPSIALPNPGTAAVTVGNFTTTLTPKRADGSPTDLGTFTSACTLKPGQNTQLGTFEIKPGGGTTSPSSTPPSTTPTSATPTSTTPTSTTPTSPTETSPTSPTPTSPTETTPTSPTPTSPTPTSPTETTP